MRNTPKELQRKVWRDLKSILYGIAPLNNGKTRRRKITQKHRRIIHDIREALIYK